MFRPDAYHSFRPVSVDEHFAVLPLQADAHPFLRFTPVKFLDAVLQALGFTVLRAGRQSLSQGLQWLPRLEPQNVGSQSLRFLWTECAQQAAVSAAARSAVVGIIAQ